MSAEKETLGPNVLGESISLDDSGTSGLGFVGFSEESQDSQIQSANSEWMDLPIDNDANTTIQRQKALINRLYVRLSSRKKTISTLTERNAALQSRLDDVGEDVINQLKNIKEGVTRNDPFSVFMMNQVIINLK